MISHVRISQAILQEALRVKSPNRMLVLGAQVHSIVTTLIEHLGDDDFLMVSDPTKGRIPQLKDRFERLPKDSRLDCVQLTNQHIWEIEPEQLFNTIIITLPLDVLDEDTLHNTLEACSRLLAPGGTVSCFELAYLRNFKEILSKLWAINSCQSIKVSPTEHYVRGCGVYQQTVWGNMPPVTVHHLRFTPSPIEQARELKPNENRHCLVPLRISRDFLTFLPFGLAAAWAAKKGGCRAWYLPLVMLGGVAAFLRDPERYVEADPTKVLSACDGKVMDVAIVTDPNLGPLKWLRIATFLSITDVHINRSPVAGRIIDQFRVSGGNAIASLPQATHNHACYTVIETENGQVAVAQRVGMVARRIANWVNRGELLAQGERYGLIRMGSRTDIFLPPNRYRPTVKPGDMIKAGQDVVATLYPNPHVVELQEV